MCSRFVWKCLKKNITMFNYFHVILCTYKGFVIKKYTILPIKPYFMMYFIHIKNLHKATLDIALRPNRGSDTAG